MRHSGLILSRWSETQQHRKGYAMQTGHWVMRTTIGIGLVTFLSACEPPISEPIVLAAMEAPLLVMGSHVQRIDDEPLTASFRNVVGIWQVGQ